MEEKYLVRHQNAIAVDVMGADMGVSEVIRAVKLALEELPSLEHLVLVGKERTIARLLKVVGLEKDPRLSIYNASEVIGMDEKPIESLKKKKDSSMARAIELVKKGYCQAIVSCGNTGSLMACGTLRLRTMPGVDRPALATVIPNRFKNFILIDVGANPSAKAEHLVHNAILGSHYARIILGCPQPKVGLLSIGTEETKGTQMIGETHQMLKKIDSLIHYDGLIEGFEVFGNRVDVIVCDGFTGNVVLKTCESIFYTLKDFFKDEIKKTPLRLAGAFLSQNAYKSIRNQLDPNQYGGAPLLGLNASILKAHGSSSHKAIMNAIRIAIDVVRYNMNSQSSKDIEEANRILGKGSKPKPKVREL